MRPGESNPQAAARESSNKIQRYRVVVTGIDTSSIGQDHTDPNGMALTIDTFGRERKVGVSTMIGSGAIPQVGDEWIIDWSLGTWTFLARINPIKPLVTDATSLAVAMNTLGLINYQPAPPASGSVVQKRAFNGAATGNFSTSSTVYVGITTATAGFLTKQFAGTSLILECQAQSYMEGVAGPINYSMYEGYRNKISPQQCGFYFNNLGVLEQTAWSYEWAGLTAGKCIFQFLVSMSSASMIYEVNAACWFSMSITEVWP